MEAALSVRPKAPPSTRGIPFPPHQGLGSIETILFSLRRPRACRNLPDGMRHSRPYGAHLSVTPVTGGLVKSPRQTFFFLDMQALQNHLYCPPHIKEAPLSWYGGSSESACSSTGTADRFLI